MVDGVVGGWVRIITVDRKVWNMTIIRRHTEI